MFYSFILSVSVFDNDVVPPDIWCRNVFSFNFQHRECKTQHDGWLCPHARMIFVGNETVRSSGLLAWRFLWAERLVCVETAGQTGVSDSSSVSSMSIWASSASESVASSLSAVYLSCGPPLIWLHSYSNPPARAADGTGLCPSNVSDALNAACFTGLSHISAPDICIYSPSLLQSDSRDKPKSCLLLPLGQVCYSEAFSHSHAFPVMHSFKYNTQHAYCTRFMHTL